MNKKYDTLVYIGRFQPIHSAHIEIIRQATELARQVIIIIGSARQPRTYKNPFSSAEREIMIRSATADTGDRNCSIRIEHNTDTIYNDQAWAARVQELVNKHTAGLKSIGIIGHDKDESTFYLKMFPQWDRVEVDLIEPLNATDIRDIYFRKDVNTKFLSGVVPASTLVFLENFRNTHDFEQIIREREFVANYKRQYEGLPYPPIFVTSDAVVVCSGHVLMIKRRAEPGKNLMALPGGYVNAKTDKSVEDAAIRELREETMIKVPVPVLRGSIVYGKVYDAIDRSQRGRVITHAFLIQLPDGQLPKVKGSDDAIKAKWIPFAEIKSEETFEDHYEIIRDLVGF